jgi:putative membrane protein
MLDLVIRLVINAVAVFLAINFVPGAAFDGEIWKLILVAAVIGLVNAYLRPIVKLLALPLNLMTFGLVGLVINAAMVMVAAAISDNLKLGFSLGGWPTTDPQIGLDTIIAAFLTALLISIVSALVALVRKIAPGI